MADDNTPRPSTISSDEKWDHSMENFVRKSTIGLAVGILPALLLARSTPARGAIAALCTGIGGGVAYGEARYLFDHNIMFDKRSLIQVSLATDKAATES